MTHAPQHPIAGTPPSGVLPAAARARPAHRAVLARDGVLVLRRALPRAAIDRLRIAVDQRYDELDRLCATHGPFAVERHLPPGWRYLPTAASFSLDQLATGGAIDGIAGTLANASVRDLVEAALGGAAGLLEGAAWVRRQQAPGNAPDWHRPHSWHQDGALGFDFRGHDAQTIAAAAPRALVTCWFPLVPCGRGAPGLEWVAQRLPTLLPPADLDDARVRARFGAGRRYAPALAPGDAVVLCGDLLHRTHVTAAMQAVRTSIELRFVRTPCTATLPA